MVPRIWRYQMVEFYGLSKRSVFKKALDFWYKELRDKMTLNDFAKHCVWKLGQDHYVVIYKGPDPKTL